MSECDLLRDRMPDVAAGRAAWTPADAEHLDCCDACAAEWRLVQAGSELGAPHVVDPDRIAAAVLARLREAPAPVAPVRRIPWRGAVIGVLAAAASLVLYLASPQLRRPAQPGGGDTAIAAILPELQGLDDRQLETVLQSMGPAAGDAAPGLVPHLEDLTDSELEQLLHSGGGE